MDLKGVIERITFASQNSYIIAHINLGGDTICVKGYTNVAAKRVSTNDTLILKKAQKTTHKDHGLQFECKLIIVFPCWSKMNIPSNFVKQLSDQVSNPEECIINDQKPLHMNESDWKINHHRYQNYVQNKPSSEINTENSKIDIEKYKNAEGKLDYDCFKVFIKDCKINIHESTIEKIYDKFSGKSIETLLKDPVLLLNVESLSVSSITNIIMNDNLMTFQSKPIKKSMKPLSYLINLQMKNGDSSSCTELKMDDKMKNIIKKYNNVSKLFVILSDRISIKMRYDEELIICENILYIHNNLLSSKSCEEYDDGLNKEQIKAVNNASCGGISIVTGKPGTGKSKVLKTIIDIFKENGAGKILVVAPTGKAVKNLCESIDNIDNSVFTGDRSIMTKVVEYMTLHKFIHSSDSVFNNDTQKIYVLIDECSMIDNQTMYSFLSKLCNKYKDNYNIQGLVMFGDTYQLPPIGYGDLFRGFINSQCFPSTELLEVFRYKDSDLKDAIEDINKGIIPCINRKDGTYEVIHCSSDDIECEVLDYIRNNFTNDTFLQEDVLVVSPSNDKVTILNSEISQIMNDKRHGDFNGSNTNKFFVGDVIRFKKNAYKYEEPNEIVENETKQTKKNKNKNTNEPNKTTFNKDIPLVELVEKSCAYPFYNGTVGQVTKLLPQIVAKRLVKDNNKQIKEEHHLMNGYDTYFQNLDMSYIQYNSVKENTNTHFELAYAGTVHKAQGSQADTVIIVLNCKDTCPLLRRSLLYTAVSRAKKKCIIFTIKSNYQVCITNTPYIRKTSIQHILNDLTKKSNN